MEDKVVALVSSNWTQGRQDRAEKEKGWDRCWKAFSLYVDPELYKDQPWRNKFPSPWAYQSGIYGHTQLKSILMPNDENFFKIRPVNQGDEQQILNAELLTKYQRRKFKKGNFNNATDSCLLQGSIIGSTCMKVYWKMEEGPIDGETDGLTFDGLWYEFVNMKDFVVYPANSADISKSMQIHKTFYNISDIKQMDEKNGGVYRNTDEIDSANTAINDTDDLFAKNVSSYLGVKDPKPPRGQVELLEAWGDFNIDGTLYKDFVATVVNRKHLIRFQRNPYLRKPFIFFSIRDIPGSAYGEGFIEKGLPIKDLSETLDNMIIDETLLKIQGQYGFDANDKSFDPDNFEIRPGGLHGMDKPDTLWRIDNSTNLSTPLTMKESLKQEFEETTTVLKYAKGSQSGGSDTATGDTILSQASDKNFTNVAKHLNEVFLEEVVALSYDLIRLFDNPENIAKYTGADPSILNLGIPLSDMDIDITGLSTAIDDNEKIKNIEKVITMSNQLPIAGMIKQRNLVEDWLKLNGLDDMERYLEDPQICEAIQQNIILMNTQAIQAQEQQEQQAQMMQQQQQIPQGKPGSLPSPELPAPTALGAEPQ